MSRTLLVYGGSFDPPHMSHVLALCAARALVGPCELLVVPSFQHPFGKQLAPYEARLQLCELAFGWLPALTVSRIEEELHGQRAEVRTVDVLLALRARMPEAAMRLLVGADILHDAPKWHRWDEVCALAPPLVLGRVGHEHPEAPAAMLPAISSREVRAMLLQGAPVPEGWLPDGVLPRIRALRLYGEPSQP